MRHYVRNILLSLYLLVNYTGCIASGYYNNDTADVKKNDNTLGKAQKEIKIGMSSAQVISTMGSPNVISTDEKRREVWVYDKMSTSGGFESSSSFLIFGSAQSGSYAKSQRTLTVIIKFDENQTVRDLSYHSSSF